MAVGMVVLNVCATNGNGSLQVYLKEQLLETTILLLVIQLVKRVRDEDAYCQPHQPLTVVRMMLAPITATDNTRTPGLVSKASFL